MRGRPANVQLVPSSRSYSRSDNTAREKRSTESWCDEATRYDAAGVYVIDLSLLQETSDRSCHLQMRREHDGSCRRELRNDIRNKTRPAYLLSCGTSRSPVKISTTCGRACSCEQGRQRPHGCRSKALEPTREGPSGLVEAASEAILQLQQQLCAAAVLLCTAVLRYARAIACFSSQSAGYKGACSATGMRCKVHAGPTPLPPPPPLCSSSMLLKQRGPYYQQPIRLSRNKTSPSDCICMASRPTGWVHNEYAPSNCERYSAVMAFPAELGGSNLCTFRACVRAQKIPQDTTIVSTSTRSRINSSKA